MDLGGAAVIQDVALTQDVALGPTTWTWGE